MSVTQIIFYALLAFILYVYIKRYLASRKVKSYSSAEAAASVKNNKSILLDVRTNRERSQQKINGSFHIPLSELSGRINELKKFKSKEIICYCRSGNRSLSAAITLQKNNFNSANLKGGILRWNSERK